MSESISWSLTAGSTGGSMDDSGTLETEAVTAGSVTVDGGAAQELSFQLTNVDKVVFLAVKASSYAGTVKLKAAGNDASEVVMTGPLVLFGEAIKLFGASLATMTVTNQDNAQAVSVHVLLGHRLTA